MMEPSLNLARMTVLEAALHYASLGYEVFPVATRDKMPAIAKEDGGCGVHDATTDVVQITEWFTAKYTNIGIAVPPGVIVLDIDVQSGGHLVFKRWQAEHGKAWTAQAPRQRTGNKGVHLWFAYDGPALRYKHPDFVGVECAAEGRYVVVSPSVHENGTQYVWEVDLPALTSFTDRPTVPAWFTSLFTQPASLTPTGRRLSSYAGEDALDVAAHIATSWSTLLPQSQWKLVRGSGDDDGSKWRHGAAHAKWSATIKHGCLFVYSPNTPFKETTSGDPNGYTLFGAVALLQHGGDFKATARWMRQEGYLDDTREDDQWLARITSNPVRPMLAPPSNVIDVEGEEVDADLVIPEDKLGVPVHWPTFWLQEADLDARWLSEPIVALGRAHALHAGAKTGKSLLLLQLCAALATGQPFLDKAAHEPVSVLYADYEMTEDDLRQRLEGFGYSAADDLTLLRYYFLGSGSALDKPEGGRALIETAHDCGAKLVVIDTTARAVSGAENDADTLRSFYRWSGVGLKRLGISWVRIDHSGKDEAKGQRGTSAKNDDVDVVWKLRSRGENSFTLEATHQRMGWVPKSIELALDEDNYGNVHWKRRGGRIYGPGVKETADLLDELRAPLTISKRDAREQLKSAGWKGRDQLLIDAFAWRAEAGFRGIINTGQS